ALTLGAASALFAIAATRWLALVLLLGVAGLAVVGTLAAAVACQARGREALVPLLMVPVLAPLLQAGIAATLGAIDGAGWETLRVPILAMAGYDMLAAGLAWFLWPVA